MFTRRIVMAALGAVLILTAGVMPASAAGPSRPGQIAERPQTPKEKAASDRKIAAAMRYLASPRARAELRSSLDCATPDGSRQNGITNQAPDEVGDLSDLDALAGPSSSTACAVPKKFLPVSARDQIRGHYCGPAVGQVIANYTWAVPLDDDRYTQKRIADWMRTDDFGQTGAEWLANGLDAATARAPRLPPVWDWVVTKLEDTDGDGAVGDQMHDYVRATVSGSSMPLAISVKPHDAAGRFHLSSWPNPVASVGHWIAAYGWRGIYDGTTFARIYYTDSSEDEGGSTGKFWDPSKHIAGMIRDHTQRFVW
jgi:hypothetical protein